MNDSPILITEADGVATITLNRPEKHNAFDDKIIAELIRLIADIEKDDSLRVLILAANGKSFSAGGDLAWMKRTASYSREQNQNDAAGLAELLRSLNNLSIPTIARVQGAAFGGAVGLTSCCDMAVGTQYAKFCLSEVRVGLVPATISPYVIAAIGQRAARRYFLTAERFSAQTALELGLLSAVVEPEQLDDEIAKLVEALLSNGPAALTAAKKLIADVANQPISAELIEQTSKLIADLRISPEGQEGLSAFLEKRKPHWIKT